MINRTPNFRELDALLYFSLFQLLTLFLFSCVVYINSSAFEIGFPITKKAPSVYEQAPLNFFSMFFLRHQFLVFFLFFFLMPVLLLFELLCPWEKGAHQKSMSVNDGHSPRCYKEWQVSCHWSRYDKHFSVVLLSIIENISMMRKVKHHGAWLMPDRF